jgi:hypothetical protein
MLRTHLIRSDERSAFSVLSSGATVWTNTKEASPTELLVPTPTLMFGVKSTGVIAYAGSIVAPPTSPKPFEAASEAAATKAGSGAPPKAKGMSSASDGDKADLADGRGSSPAAEPAAQPPIWAQAIERLPTPQADSSKIYLSIDSLPHHELIETFPVTVAQLGDKLFTATVEALRLSGTSSTLGEALVTVKEEIEALYERLIKNNRLDSEERGDLKYLQSHIKPSKK